MPDCETQALIADLGKAEEGSRALDARIAVATFDEPSPEDDSIYAKVPLKVDYCAVGTYWRKTRSGSSLQTAPHYTTSVDSKLPGEDIVTVMKIPDGFSAEHMEVYPDGLFKCFRGEAKTEPLARRIASLRAKEAGEHQTIAEMTAVSPEEMNRPVTNFNASRRKGGGQ